MVKKKRTDVFSLFLFFFKTVKDKGKKRKGRGKWNGGDWRSGRGEGGGGEWLVDGGIFFTVFVCQIKAAVIYYRQIDDLLN